MSVPKRFRNDYPTDSLPYEPNDPAALEICLNSPYTEHQAQQPPSADSTVRCYLPQWHEFQSNQSGLMFNQFIMPMPVDGGNNDAIGYQTAVRAENSRFLPSISRQLTGGVLYANNDGQFIGNMPVLNNHLRDESYGF